MNTTSVPEKAFSLLLSFFVCGSTMVTLIKNFPKILDGIRHSDLGLSLDSKSADQKAKAVIPEKANLVSLPLPKNLVPSYQM